MGYLNHKYLYQGCSMDSLFQSALGRCCLASLAAPSGPGRHGPLSSCTILCHCYAPQSQPPTGPPDAVCPAKTATAIG